MNIIDNETLICVDIDYTLLMWKDKIKKGHKVVLFTDPYSKEQKYVRVHEPNLKILTSHLARGSAVIVWSASGSKWAKEAMRALKLKHHNLHVFCKPRGYVDDKSCDKWMGEQIYLDVEDGWK